MSSDSDLSSSFNSTPDVTSVPEPLPELSSPRSGMFTIYSKSGCSGCTKLKKYLTEHFVVFQDVCCDEWLIEPEHKAQLFQLLTMYADQSCSVERRFPIVFDGLTYVGGVAETKACIANWLQNISTI